MKTVNPNSFDKIIKPNHPVSNTFIPWDEEDFRDEPTENETKENDASEKDSENKNSHVGIQPN